MYRALLFGLLACASMSSCERTAPRSAAQAETPELPAIPARTEQWREGVHYERIEPAMRSNADAQHVEVTEFFWFGCPHCFDLEPYLRKWLETKPEGVQFTRVAVAWDRPDRIAHARLFYALQSLDRPDLHAVVFDEIHKQGNPLFVPGNEAATLSLQRKFTMAHGIAADEFADAYAAAAAQIQPANDRARAARITGVPTVTVDGKYRTDSGLAGGPQNVFAVVDAMIERERATLHR